jgi:hypothetical protein
VVGFLASKQHGGLSDIAMPNQYPFINKKEAKVINNASLVFLLSKRKEK